MRVERKSTEDYYVVVTLSQEEAVLLREEMYYLVMGRPHTANRVSALISQLPSRGERKAGPPC